MEDDAVTSELYNGRDPRDVPTYTIREAARYLNIPTTTLHRWVLGHEFADARGKKHKASPVIRLASAKPELTFWNLAEAYVLAAIRRYHEVPLQTVRKALRYVEKELDLDRPLIEKEFLTNGVDLFVEEYGHLINASQKGQLAIKKLLEQTLRRVERDPKGLVARLFPWSRSPDEPKDVEIDPLRAFGRLVIAGTGIPTEIIAERIRAGDTIAHLAEDYRIDRDKIEAAVRWELGPPTAD